MNANYILIVEHDLTFGQSLSTLIEEEGYTTSYVRSANAAMESLQLHKPDALLINAQLPTMSGFAFTQWVRLEADFRNIPIALMIPADNDIVRLKASGVGATVVLPLPFDLPELNYAISELWKGERL